MNVLDKLKQKAKGYSDLLLVLLIVVLLVSLARNVVKIKKVGNTIEEARESVTALEEENAELEKRAQEVQSQEYIEGQLRNELGLVREGEVVLILPEDDVLRKLAPEKEKESEALPDPNWKKWLNLFI